MAERIEETKLIVNFLGLPVHEYEDGRIFVRIFHERLEYEWKNILKLQYHESWDWLIPLCKKISDVSTNQDRPSINHCNKLDWIETEMRTLHLAEYDLQKTYEKALEFITIYNGKD